MSISPLAASVLAAPIVGRDLSQIRSLRDVVDAMPPAIGAAQRDQAWLAVQSSGFSVANIASLGTSSAMYEALVGLAIPPGVAAQFARLVSAMNGAQHSFLDDEAEPF